MPVPVSRSEPEDESRRRPPPSVRKVSMLIRARSSESAQSDEPVNPPLNASQSNAMEAIQLYLEVASLRQRVS